MANSSRSRSNWAGPVWCTIRTAMPDSRNKGQLSRPASFSVLDPWLPPVIRTRSSAERGLGGMRKELFAHGQSRDFGPAGRKVPRRFRKRDQRAAHEPADDAIGESRHGVGLHNHHRNAPRQRRRHGRSGRVPSHAEDRGDAAQQLAAGEGGERKPAQRGQSPPPADPIQTANLDKPQLEPFGGDQLGLNAAVRADEEDRVAPPPQFARHGQGRNYVAARASARHEKGLRHGAARAGPNLSDFRAPAQMVGRTPWSAAGPLAGFSTVASTRFLERRAGPGGPARTRGSAPP